MDQGLAPSRVLAGHMARFFIGLEFALGFLMLLPFYVKQLMQFTFLLLGGFTVHLIYLWAIGDTENCGCFGEMISMTPEQSILKNLVMILVAFVVYKTTQIRQISKLFLWVLQGQPSLVCGCFYRCLITRIFLLRPLLNLNQKEELTFPLVKS